MAIRPTHTKKRGAQCAPFIPQPSKPLLGAGLALDGMVALGLGIGFAHVFAGLGLTVELGTFAMVGLGTGVDPNPVSYTHLTLPTN